MTDEEYFDRLDEMAEKVVLRLAGQSSTLNSADLALLAYGIARQMMERSLFERNLGQLASEHLVRQGGDYRGGKT